MPRPPKASSGSGSASMREGLRRRFRDGMAGAILALTALAAAPGLSPGTAVAQEIVIGTGAANGVYFHVGRSICRLIERNATDLTCEPLATEGSLFNLNNLQSGAIEIGLAQSDWQYHAYNKSGPYEAAEQDFKTLRSLFSVHSEAFTVLARADAAIDEFDDLRGKRVDIGSDGSGHRATMEVVMDAKGWGDTDIEAIGDIEPEAQINALCNDRVQALVFMIGHPNPAIGKAVGLCGAVLVDVGDDDIAELIATTPYYAPVTIPEAIYPASEVPVSTFGVRATVVTSSEVDAAVIYELVKAVFEDLEIFRNYHPSFQTLEAKRMVSEGLTAPLHAGALRYYREKGLR